VRRLRLPRRRRWRVALALAGAVGGGAVAGVASALGAPGTYAVPVGLAVSLPVLFLASDGTAAAAVDAASAALVVAAGLGGGVGAVAVAGALAADATLSVAVGAGAAVLAGGFAPALR
jgi:hypothetical protein